MNTPARLKEARELIGYTILKASRLSGIRYSEICRFERGTQEPKWLELCELADIYKVKASALVSDRPIKRTKVLWCKEKG